MSDRNSSKKQIVISGKTLIAVSNFFATYHLPLTTCRLLCRLALTAVLLTAYHLPLSYAAHLLSNSLQALDSAGAPRTPAIFNNSEKIGFQYNVINTQSQTGFIQFSFSLTDPQGKIVFSQSGNAVSAEQVGLTGTSIVGVSVAQIYTVPGTYQLKGTAQFSDTSETVSATIPIDIFSPILNLTYPPDRSQNLTDQPVIFRWIGTGATRYKITVADNPTLFNPILQAEVTETQFSYPTNPTDTRQRLASGQVYYWSVLGVDSLGTKTSEASYPYSFSIAGAATSAQSKDLALLSIEPSPLPAPSPNQALVVVTVKNQGGRPESGVTVACYVQGILQEKKNIDFINPSEEKMLSFIVYPPKTQSGSGYLVTANIAGISDDNLFNNFLTAQIPWPKIELALARAKILGSVWVGNKKAGEGTVVSYDGPKSGKEITNAGGEYKIEDLPIGDYTLVAKVGTQESVPVVVAVTEGRTYANRDLRISEAPPRKRRRAGGEALSRISEAAKSAITKAAFSALPKKIADELKGYKLDSVDAPGMNEEELEEILEGIADGSVKILSVVMQ